MKRLYLLGLITIFLTLDTLPSLRAETTLKTVASFTTTANGIYPLSTLIQGSDGNFYGTTVHGGISQQGVIYQMTPQGKLKTLARFGGPDTVGTASTLTEGSNGSFYGISEYGGAFGKGTVFKLSLDGQLTCLHSFDGKLGINPTVALVRGNGATLYGAIGATIYKITSAGVLTAFASMPDGSGITDLVRTSEGSFACMTRSGWLNKISQSGEVTLFSNLSPLAITSEGGIGLTQANDGSFYGMNKNHYDIDGSIFHVDVNGKMTILCKVTDFPTGKLVMGNDGNLYGESVGYIFQVTPKGGITPLVYFNGINGGFPTGLIKGRDGGFYGAAERGGRAGLGTIFSFNQPPPATLEQTIAFPAVESPAVRDTIELQAQASSHLPISYTVLLGPATVTGNFLTLTGAGLVKVIANQAGNAAYLPAKAVLRNISVRKGSQIIQPFSIDSYPIYEPSILFYDKPRATSGLPVSVTVKSGSARILNQDNWHFGIEFYGRGAVTLVASQAGDQNYTAAKSITTSFVVKSAE